MIITVFFRLLVVWLSVVYLFLMLHVQIAAGKMLSFEKGENVMKLLPAVTVETGENPSCSVIWLHGLGADGNDFVPIASELRLPEDLQIRFIFPHAPSIPVTINGGMVMPAWYDILEMEIDRKVDTVQLRMSADAISHFIDAEIEKGIKSERIIIAGFSQGGAVAYQAVLSYDKPLAGFLAMSTYFATADTVVLNPVNSDIPILVQHGIYDPVVPESLGQKAIGELKKKGYSPEYMTYPMEHQVCMEQIADISEWLQKRCGR